MIRLQLLGAIELQGVSECAAKRLLSQPKRLALLGYLCLGGRRGYQPRERLLGIFWPDSDDEHARASLRQGLYFLRGVVGRAIVTRGNEVGVDGTRLLCDAAELERLSAAGRKEEALGLYAGDLLPGLYVAQAAEFERWLEEERARLRTVAVDLARELADEARAEGRRREALVYARRAHQLSPTDEVLLRGLVEELVAQGDRGGAIDVYESYVRLLDQEYGLEPSPETTAVLEELRGGPQAEVPESRSGRWRLANADGPAGRSSALEVAAVIGLLRRRGRRWWRRSVRRLAGWSGWGTARFVRTRRILFAAVLAAVGLALVSGLAGGISPRASTPAIPDEPALSPPTHPVSAPATSRYAQGERRLRRGDAATAVEDFTAALAEDSGFALARYGLSVAAASAHQWRVAREATERALQSMNSLAPRHRSMLMAQRAYVNGAAREAERLYLEVLAQHPDEVWAWLALGEIRLRLNPAFGRSPQEAASAFERVLLFAPEHRLAHQYLAELAVLRRDRQEFERRMTAAFAGREPLGWRVVRAAAFAPSEGLTPLLPELRALDGAQLHGILYSVGRLTGDVPAAERLSDLLVAGSQPPAWRAAGHAVRAHLRLARADWRGAMRDLDRVALYDARYAVRLRAHFLALPFAEPRHAEIDAALEELAGAHTAAARPATGGFALDPYPDPRVDCYLAGQLEAGRGNRAAALDRARCVAGGGDAAAPTALAADPLAASILARLAHATGEHDAALGYLTRSVTDQPVDRGWSPILSGARERFLRGDVLSKLGRLDEALAWLESAPAGSVNDLLYAAPVELMKSRILEAQGQHASAAEHREHFESMWGQGPPRLARP